MPVKSKNYLRREFRKATRTQKLLEAIQNLSKKFTSAVRDHAKARKLSLKDDYQFIFVLIDILHATLMSHDVSMCAVFFLTNKIGTSSAL